jgi:hypothetical protein
MSLEEGFDEAGTCFFLALLTGAFAAGFLVLPAVAGMVMPGMLP